jgi:hypothetical protein
LGTFWLKIEQFWPFEEIFIFSNSGHLEWRAGLSDTILKGNHPGTIPARLGLTVTKNKNFFKWPKLLYFKSECVQI